MTNARVLITSVATITWAATAASAGISGYTFANLGSNRLAETRLRIDASVIDAIPRTELLDANQNLLDTEAAASLNAAAMLPSAGGTGTLTGSASQVSSILLGGVGSRVEVSGQADASTPATTFPEEASVDSTSFFSVELLLAAGQYDIAAVWETSAGSTGRGTFSLRAVGGTIDTGFLFTAGDGFGGADVGSAATTLTLAGDASHYVLTFDLDATAGGVAAAAATRFAAGSVSLVRVPSPAGASGMLIAGSLLLARRRRGNHR